MDSQKLTEAVSREAEQAGVTVALGQEVVGIEEGASAVTLKTKNQKFMTTLLINCAGLHADRLAHMMGLGLDFLIAPFRGEYFVVSCPGPPIIRSMVYPVPHSKVPFLGVHLTRTVSGSVLIGPNAVPAFGREAYHWGAVSPRDVLEMIRHKGFWNALIKNRELVK
ncbi:MAG: FAD-dependent oxidoreductase, partial [Nitrospirae bacterium]